MSPSPEPPVLSNRTRFRHPMNVAPAQDGHARVAREARGPVPPAMRRRKACLHSGRRASPPLARGRRRILSISSASRSRLRRTSAWVPGPNFASAAAMLNSARRIAVSPRLTSRMIRSRASCAVSLDFGSAITAGAQPLARRRPLCHRFAADTADLIRPAVGIKTVSRQSCLAASDEVNRLRGRGRSMTRPLL
jgi:hypothetical protein